MYTTNVFIFLLLLSQHPGGDDIILEHAGFDATSVFKDVGHSKDAHQMLAEYFIGEVSKVS